MRGFVFYLVFVFTGFLCCQKQKAPNTTMHSYHRIISFAPSITETLFALSLGDRVVGVTDFCNYPPDAKNLPKVGGYTNPNYEIILRLKPDLVVLLKENSSLFGFLNKNKIEYLCIENQNISQILSSFIIIGKKCNREKQADLLIKVINSEITRDVINPPWPKTLICVDRENRGNGEITRIYCASKKSFYNDLLNAACMENVLKDSTMTYPEISSEGIIRMQPEIIIDFAMSQQEIPVDRLKFDWKSIPMLPAVKNNMIFCISDDYATIPGPRILTILQDFKKINSAYYGMRKATDCILK